MLIHHGRASITIELLLGMMFAISMLGAGFAVFDIYDNEPVGIGMMISGVVLPVLAYVIHTCVRRQVEIKTLKEAIFVQEADRVAKAACDHVDFFVRTIPYPPGQENVCRFCKHNWYDAGV